MVAIQADYGPKNVQLIVINANDATKYPADSFPMMKERATEQGFNFPYLYDETQEVARSYGAQHTPEVFVFDNQNQLHYHGSIDDSHDDPKAVKHHYLRAALDAVLAGQTAPVGETQSVGCTIKWK